MATPAQTLSTGLSPIDWLSRAILFAVPSVSARALGIYRILFGIVFLTFFWVHMAPGHLVMLSTLGSRYFLNSWPLLSELSAQPLARSIVYYCVVGSLCFFVVGLFTRAAFVLLVVAFWLTALMTSLGHSVTPLILALTVTLNTRWGAGFSLDNLVFRREVAPGRSVEFGYPIWLMGLCICLAYTSAGLSKLYLTGGAWIWDAGARWGFMADMRNAATLWGLVFINHLPLGVLASVFAGIGQVLYVYSCFTRSLLVKSAIGLGIALPFLVGLMLFMGLFWWPWFTLVLLWYLPWTKIDRLIDRASTESPDVPPRRGTTGWAAGAGALLILGHAYVVAIDAEYEPLWSNYPMYVTALPMGSQEEAERWEEHVSEKPSFVYMAAIETGDGRVVDISDRYRWSVFPERFLRIEMLYRQAMPADVWTLAEAGQIPDALCRVQREIAAKFVSDQPATDIVYSRRRLDLVDGRLVWSDKSQLLRVSLTPQGCSFRWDDSGA